MINGTQYSCHNCGRSDGRMVAKLAPGATGWQHKHRWMCADCLFNAVENSELELTYEGVTFTGFRELERGHGWSCYHCMEGRQIVGYLPGILPDDLQFLCPDCLLQVVIEGRITVAPVGKTKAETEAAPTGPTATIDEATGTVSVEGIEFRW